MTQLKTDIPKEVREAVAKHLDGFDVRQIQRNAAREMVNRLHKVYSLRRSGMLNTIEEARPSLESIGVSLMEEELWGVRLLHLSCGAMLAYRPDGTLDWHARVRTKRVPGKKNQLELFIDPEEEDDPFGFNWDDITPAAV